MDTQPRIQRSLTDSNGDGIKDSSTTLVLNAEGNQIARYIDNGLDGSIDYSITSTYTYDDIGNLTITFFADNDGDGDIDLELPYIYDTQGNQINNSGPFGSSAIARPENNIRYTYDDAGNPITIEDGRAGTLTQITYDATGNQLSVTVRSAETDNIIRARTFEYNERGDVTTTRVDFNGDGSFDNSVQNAYTYDDNGNVLSQVTTGSGSNTTRLFTYDEAGNLTRRSVDFGSDGNPEQVFSFTYDAAGNLLQETTESSGRTRTVIYTYDANGNRLSESNDFDGDGIIDSSTTFSYPDALAAPIAVDDAFTNAADLQLVGNVLADNGSGADQNPEDIFLRLSGVNGEVVEAFGTQTTLTSGALLTIRPDGRFVYDPNGAFDTLQAGDTATDSFTYTVANGIGTTDTATVTLSIQGVGPFVGAPTLLRQTLEDRNGDGFPESVVTYTYDAGGNQTSEVSDFNADGIVDAVGTANYDETGREIRTTEDRNADGTPERITTTTYDANGSVVSGAFDRLGEGRPTAGFRNTFDADGNLIESASDSDLDGVFEFISTYTYDANGNQTSERFDTDGDGTADSFILSTFDAFGNQTSERRGFGVGENITINSATTAQYVYDEQGRLLSRALDVGDDGTIERIIRYSPYEIETEIGTDFVGGFFGSLGFRGTIDVVYDDQNRLSTESIDFSSVGSMPNVSRLYEYSETSSVLPLQETISGIAAGEIYTYDPNGNLIRRITDFGADGIFDEITTFAYDDSGNLTETKDFDSNGDLEGVVRYTYDANDNLTTLNSDNIGVFLITYTYDDFGNLLTESFDSRSDGTIDRITTNTYTAAPATSPTTPDTTTVLSETFTYDAVGNLTITYRYDRDGDAETDSIFSYTFDTNGTQVEEIRDYDADGTIDFVMGLATEQPLDLIDEPVSQGSLLASGEGLMGAEAIAPNPSIFELSSEATFSF